MPPGVGMIADHQREIAPQFSVSLPIQQIDQAMVVLRNEDGHARTAIAQGDTPVHAELVSDRAKRAVEVFHIQTEARQVPFDARQEVALFTSLMLLEVQDVAIVAIDEFGDSSIQALAVRALHQKHCGVLHSKLLFFGSIVREDLAEKALRLRDAAEVL